MPVTAAIKCLTASSTALTMLGLTTQVASAACQLGSAREPIKHVMVFTFDNTHFTRDKPNIPSDLDQMPNLLGFLTRNGLLDANHHTPLISHTATDILTALTGLYGERMGIPVANSFGFFRTDGSVGFQSSFGYWTDTIPNGTPLMVGERGKTAPAPWVPFTRAGCDVGAVASANIVLENNTTNITSVFGAGSPEAKEANSTQGTADFVGLAVHCAQDSSLCASGRDDLLPDEPGGYTGFKAQFGHKNVAPLIAPSNGQLTDLNGNPLTGFPGFDGMAAEVSLSYVAALHEHGVNVTFAYISDAHDNHVTATAFGPGEAGYVAALRDYDQAFGVFFARLAADGITAANTLFIFTADEGDHFVGGPPSPANCDGVNVPCTYANIGEIDASLDRLLTVENGVTTQFAAHFDSAPTIYVNGNPGQFAPTTFGLEVAIGGLVAINPITQNQDELAAAFADRTTMKLLHMVTQDPARTPSFTMFGDPDYFFLTSPTSTCSSPINCVVEAPAFAWNHGDIQPDITTTWLGMAGPGVRHLGVTRKVWSDHADIRPTLLALVGLDDDYMHDGIPLFEFTRSGSSGGEARSEAARIYKQLNAPVGEFGLGVVALITQAIKNHDPVGYAQAVSQLEALGAERDRIAVALRSLLDAPSSKGSKSDGQNVSGLIDDADRLLARVADAGQAPEMHDDAH